ncbi:MAG: TauD/TfdA family dioxygenase [Sphingobium sp.]
MPIAEKAGFEVRNVAPRIGSEIVTDVETLLSGACSAQIRALLEERGVVAIRGLNLTDDQQIAFTKTIGTIVRKRLSRSRWTPGKSGRRIYQGCVLLAY